MDGSEARGKSRRKSLKPVSFRGFRGDDADSSMVSEPKKLQQELENVPQKAEDDGRTIARSSKKCMDSRVPSWLQIKLATRASPAELVKTSPRSTAKKEQVSDPEDVQPAFVVFPAATNLRTKQNASIKAQKRCPLSESNSVQAKRTRRNKADPQPEAQINQEVASSNSGVAELAQDVHVTAGARPVRKGRRLKKEPEHDGKTEKISENSELYGGEKTNRAAIHNAILQALNILEYPPRPLLCKALDDVLVEGIPVAVAAAQRGLAEFYLRNFVQTVCVHIRQMSCFTSKFSGIG